MSDDNDGGFSFFDWLFGEATTPGLTPVRVFAKLLDKNEEINKKLRDPGTYVKYSYCSLGNDCPCGLPKVCLKGKECDCGRTKACSATVPCDCGRMKVCIDKDCKCTRPKCHFFYF